MRRLLPILLCLPLAACAAPPGGFQVHSGQLADGDAVARAQVHRGDGCTGDDRSPALAWSGEPAGTQAFAVTMFDPDAPTGHGWWHWIVYDLPATVHALPENAASALPAGARQARNDFGEAGYGGPCPPRGDVPHRYQIRILALRTSHLGITGAAAAAQVDAALQRQVLGSATLTLRYGR